MSKNMNNQIRVLVLLPVIGQPRHAKRIDMLLDKGFHVEAMAFQRNWPQGRVPNIPVKIIGKIQHKQYLRRIPTLLKAYAIIKKYCLDFDLIYCFSHDFVMVSALATRGTDKKIAIEVGDISNLQMSNNLMGKISRAIDRRVMRAVDLLVVISKGFMDFYINNLNYQNPYLVIENKIEPNSIKIDRNGFIYNHRNKASHPKTKIRIGYFGVLNDPWSWSVLKKLIMKHGEKFELFIAGKNLGLIDFDKVLLEERNIHYLGEYKSPADLTRNYINVDLSWVCYPPFKESNFNLLSGRPNRFYEACYFGIPIIARKSVAFAKDVEKYDIGVCIDTIDIDETICRLTKINKEDIKVWKEKIKYLPENLFMLSNEAGELEKSIKSIMKKDITQ